VESGLIGVMHEPKGVSLIKPPELISIKDVLDAAREGNQAGVRVSIDPHDPVHTVLHRRDQAVEQALAGQTLRSLVVEQNHRTTE
jgi:membrane protein